MSDGNRSFWSSVPGLITGLAGLLTGIVGLVTVLIQLGVVGSKGSSNASATATTATSTTATAPATFVVSPGALDFQPADPKVKAVTVRNTSSAGSIAVVAPTIVGDDGARFAVSLDTCDRPITAGLSCTVKVTFVPSGPLRTYKATLQLRAVEAARAQEVSLSATTLL